MSKRQLPMAGDEKTIGTKRALRHWHPVLIAKDLKDEPVSVKILGEPIVLFRTKEGVGAVHDRCPHRGARLSAGHVNNDGCIVCPYHLWSFDEEGKGKSPVNPKMKPFTRAFDVAEHEGLIWVKAKGAEAELPKISSEGLHSVGIHTGTIDAPFYVVVDNFTEIEHSPTNHFIFAFDEKGLNEVEPNVEVKSDSIHIRYEGPQRDVPWWTFASMLGLKSGTRHVIDFTVNFGPLHWVYDLYWEDPATGERLPQHIRQHAFITPNDDGTTSAFLIFHTSLGLFSRKNPLKFLMKQVFFMLAGNEFDLDKKICENVAEMGAQPGFEGLQLGKFDRVLRATRRLIADVYDGPAVIEETRKAG